MLNIPTDFLEFDQHEWDSRSEYQSAYTIAQSLIVVMDSAERAVSLMQTFNPVLTKNEDQKQYLLQITEERRRKYPNSKKNTVLP